MIKRPEDLRAEHAVIKTIFVEPDLFPMVKEKLSARMFVNESNRATFDALCRMYDDSIALDQVALKGYLNSNYERIGGDNYLEGINSIEILPTNVDQYTHMVKDTYMRRSAIDAGLDIADSALHGRDADVAISKLLEYSNSLSGEMVGNSKIISMSELADAQLPAFQDKVKDPGLRGIRTGIDSYDYMIGGLGRGDEILIAGRPGAGKCLGKGTRVVMFDGTLKEVENIQIGDLLMGPDSNPRKVLSLGKGIGMMYWIRQLRGVDYRVNEDHILSLKKSRKEGFGDRGDILDIDVKSYLQWSNKRKSNFKGYKVGIDFPEKDVLVAPYYLGLWLGDGDKSSSGICTQDQEIVDYLNSYASELNLSLKDHSSHNRCSVYAIIGIKSKPHSSSLVSKLRAIKVLNNKHIPDDYLYNSEEVRLKLLAGLIDSDGYNSNNCYEIIQKRRHLALQIKYLADSLGFRVSINEKYSSLYGNVFGPYFRIYISGDTDRIPVKIKRKRAHTRKSIKDWHVTGITVEEDKIDDFYGFELDKDGLFLLEDMTVTHNTSLLLTILYNQANFGIPVALFSYEMGPEQVFKRLLAIDSGVSHKKIDMGRVKPEELTRVEASFKRISALPFYMTYSLTMGVDEISNISSKLHKTYGIEVAALDYIQLLSTKEDNQNNELGRISRVLKLNAQKNEMAWLVASQLNRRVEYRDNKRPVLSDLRDSGNLEQDADIVLMVYREHMYNTIPDNADLAELLTRKNRHGPLANFPLRFNQDTMTFYSMNS